MNAVVSKDYGKLVEIALYFVAFLAIIYALYKLFGLFKNLGGDLEKKLKDLKNTVGDLNPSDAPEKFKETGEDIWTILKGTFTGKQNTGEYNEAMNRLHYGGDEWTPGTSPPVNWNNPAIKRYGYEVKPEETKVFAGGTYTETVVSNIVKDPWGGYTTKEEALAHKYGFRTYAQFNAWLSGVKSALKAEGKDPSRMSLDQIVKYGRELERKKEEWKKQNPDKATPVFDVQKNTVPSYLKQFEASDDIYKKASNWIIGGATVVPGASQASRNILPHYDRGITAR